MNVSNHIGIIPCRVRESAAWLSLSDNARRVLVALARRHNGSNNGQLLFESHDGLVLGLSAIDTERALIELESVGLIASRSMGAPL
jgi:hypothetical protein